MKIAKHNPYKLVRQENEKWTLEENPIFGEKLTEFLAFIDDCVDKIVKEWEKRPTLDDEKWRITQWTKPPSLKYCPAIKVVIRKYQSLKLKVCCKLDAFRQELLSGEEEETLFLEASELEYLSSLICHCEKIKGLAKVKGFTDFPISNWSESFLMSAIMYEDGELQFGVKTLLEEIKLTNQPSYRVINSTVIVIKL